LDKEILDLIEFISQSNFVEFELEREGFRIRLVKAGSRAGPAGVAAADSNLLTAANHPVPASVPVPAATAPSPMPAQRLHEIKSPLVGTFYRAPGPDAPAFTDLGKTVKAGQVLCIVEAMKLMNEIESDTDGVMEEILVSNGQPVEYGEVLFRIRPAASAS
jgi:acetyl-CoA carboxylase biotin carboxyl carrier protein